MHEGIKPIKYHPGLFDKYKNIDISNARKLSEQVLVLPLYEELSGEQVEFICSIIKGGR